MYESAVKKIIQKAKSINFHKSRGYSPQKPCDVCYEQEIARIDNYEGFFLIQRNMIFGSGALEDSSYTIFEFDNDGNLKAEIKVSELPENFFRDRKTIFMIK